MSNLENKIKKARKNTDTNPTDKEKESGNYKKGKINVNGFKISLENPKGSYRSGVDKSGKEWKIKMKNDYGYFLNTIGYDGDHIDVFLGSDIDSKKIFVIDQKLNGSFDESKVMLWFNTEEKAKDAYMSNYEKNWKGFDAITEVDEEFFKKWLYDGKKQRKPFHEYYEVKKRTKKMNIKESVLRNLIQESIDRVLINEGLKEKQYTKKLIKKLYDVAYPYTTGRYRDDDWRNVLSLFKTLEKTPGVIDFSYWGGKYRADASLNGKPLSNNSLLNSAYKEYMLEITTEVNTKIEGRVQCNFCGSVDDPFSVYDITVSFYEADDINVNESLDDNQDYVYTNSDWNRDGSLRVKPGQCIDYDVYEELLNSVPPTTHKATLFQPGEAYSMSDEYIPLYMTFTPHGEYWRYIGLCPKGSNKVLPEIGMYECGEKKMVNLNERRGINSKKLYQLFKQHGGLAKGEHNFYLNSLTDADVIGELSKEDLDKLFNAYPRERINWATENGFKVNRGDNVELIPLKDNTWIAIIERGSLLGDKDYVKTPIGALKSERNRNKSKIDGKNDYRWQDTNSLGSERKSEFINRQAANSFRQRFANKNGEK